MGKEKSMKNVLRFLRDDRGTETVEWAIVLGIIAVGAIVTAATIGGYVTNAFQNTEEAFRLSGSSLYQP
jgi:Flp pilus assembly pilin Flp